MKSSYDKSIAAAKAALKLASAGLVVTILAPDVHRARMEFDRLAAMIDSGDYGAATHSRILTQIDFPDSGGRICVSLPDAPIGEDDAVFAHLCHVRKS